MIRRAENTIACSFEGIDGRKAKKRTPYTPDIRQLILLPLFGSHFSQFAVFAFICDGGSGGNEVVTLKLS